MKTFKYILTILGLGLVFSFAGCGAVGSDAVLNKDNEVKANASSPFNLSLRDADKSATTNGAGPSVYQSVNSLGAQTVTSGTPINSVVFTNDFQSGQTTVTLSGGTDFIAKSVAVDPNSGVFSVGEVGSSASGPIRALEPATIEQIRATRDALIEQIKAAKDISDNAKSLLISLVTHFAGV